MIVCIVSLIFSLILQGIMTNYLGYTYETLSFLSTFYVLINLLVIRPYFENEKKYFLFVVIFGILIDIAYTNTFLLNTCLILIVYYFSKTFHFFFPYNFITLNISNLFALFLYHILTFLFLTVLKYDGYHLSMLIKILTHSVFMTILYTSFLYYLFSGIQKKFEFKEIK